MTELEDWSKKQAEPLSLFDLADKWSEALKVVGAGNGAGLIAAGAALRTFATYPSALIFIKIGGLFFFVGVLTFALGYAALQLAIFSHDEMLHAVRNEDRVLASRHSVSATGAMTGANRLTIVSALSFLLGLLGGLISLLAFSPHAVSSAADACSTGG
jgi:hypothetical protein